MQYNKKYLKIRYTSYTQNSDNNIYHTPKANKKFQVTCS